MMTMGEKAVKLHGEGCNCAQSVLCALEEYTGLDMQTAKAVSALFGGGVRCGEVCGAVSGAAMAIGAVLSADGNGAPTAPAVAQCQSLTGDFKKEYGCIRCAELVKAAGGKQRCPEFIAYCANHAAEILEAAKTEA